MLPVNNCGTVVSVLQEHKEKPLGYQKCVLVKWTLHWCEWIIGVEM